MAKASGPTVSQRLIAGTAALIDAEGGRDLSVRRLAEASERSTMCVYTHFQGRAGLLAAAHEAGAGEALDLLEAAENPGVGLRSFARGRPRMLLWLLTVSDNDELRARCARFAQALIDRLARGGRERPWDELASIVGEAVLAPLVRD